MPAAAQTPDLDVDRARSRFPALAGEWALFDNAGGTAPPIDVIDRISAYMRRGAVQHGASYELSVAATGAVEEGRAAMAALVGADADEIVINGSTTMNVYVVARALRPRLAAGDEIVVTNLDHEANIGAWRHLADDGVVIREWELDPGTATLEMSGLERVVSDRTRLICTTHCSNVVGAIHDLAPVVALAKSAGAMTFVDGVALAPHRRVDARALGVDFYAFSAYKVFGPHQGVLYGKRERLRALRGQNHDFVGENDVPYKLTPGNVNHELTAGLSGIVAYLLALAGGTDGRSVDATLDDAFDRIARHEARLSERLIAYLAHEPRVRVLGPPSTDPVHHTSIHAFVVDGKRSSEIPPVVDRHRVAIRYGDFYARRAIDALGLAERDGVVRVSMVHYNTLAEVDRLIRALEQAIHA